ncbi:hypothetical protein [Humisphaera borealis]|uniref:Uncharacterized protein n=1 Tax=Humisphaera borealis TaxID=2807512 RepID=A0A7M2WRZ1_9BACT|nr:hypothetical protein [Humisphaera borealis]QOV87370.1 hypothetical protein IPV69_13830 [Humisphaera borealis]
MLLFRSLGPAGLSILLLAISAGCQTGTQVARHRLIEHQALIDFTGLRAPEVVEPVRVQVAVPQTWVVHDVEHRPLFTHQQWKSPSARTAVGVIYARLPLPVSSGTILWLATKQYTARGDDGRELGRWDDEVGRKWFECETAKYHARGYVIVNGLDAWIAYSGFRTDVPPEPGEITMGMRCMESFVPIATGEEASKSLPTSRPSTQPALP